MIRRREYNYYAPDNALTVNRQTSGTKTMTRTYRPNRTRLADLMYAMNQRTIFERDNVRIYLWIDSFSFALDTEA